MRHRVLGVLAVAAVCLPSFTLAAPPKPIDVTQASHIDLSAQTQWCASEPTRDVTSVGAGGCDFLPVRQADLNKGLSNKAFWLQITLTNPGRLVIERWLRVGDPRLQQVAFFVWTAPTQWTRSDAGGRVPATMRPLPFAYPMLPVVLEPGEQRHILVRVASETPINLASSLWSPSTYLAAAENTDIGQAVAVGGLLLTALVAGLISLQWRERRYFYIGTALLFLSLVDAEYTGLAEAHFWPAWLPFDVRMLAVGTATTLAFLMASVRQWMGQSARHPVCYVAMLGGGASMTLALAWSCLVNYGTGMQALSLSAIWILLSASGLVLSAWRSGPRPSISMVGMYSALLLYGLFVALGWGNYVDVPSMGDAWGFLLVTPILLSQIAAKQRKTDQALALATTESANRFQFLTEMSHELRTPLSLILGNVRLLERPARQPLRAEILDSVRSNATHLLGIIDNLLDHIRGEVRAPALHPDVVDLPAFLRECEHHARLLAEQNNNQFTLDATLPNNLGAVLDADRLRQVLHNLLANAARHTQNGHIRLECTLTVLADNAVQLDFAVCDTGEGIASADQERIFRPFERGEKSTRQANQGIGMGLAIARKLVQAMGGQLGVVSQPGAGARFFFGVPTRSQALATQSEPPDTLAAYVLTPEADRLLLIDMIDSGRMTDVMDWAQSLQAREPAAARFARQLLQAAHQLDFSTLHALTQRAPHPDHRPAHPTDIDPRPPQ